MKRIILIMAVFILFGCASSTLIRTIPDGAKVKQDGVVVGITPFDLWDRSESFAEKKFILQKDGYKDKEITIKKDVIYVSRIFFPPILALPWLYGYQELYFFELERSGSHAPGCEGLSAFRCWEKKLAEMPEQKATANDVSLLIGTPPIRCETVEAPKGVLKTDQCYWELEAGQYTRATDGGLVNKYGGAAVSGSATAYQRYFRASCRINDGYVVKCNCNWQE